MINSCAEGTRAFYNPDTNKCSCNPDDGKDICLDATICSKWYEYPHWDAATETCTCLPLDAKLAARDDDAVCPNHIFCGAGAHKVFSIETNQCTCEVDPGTETCPLMSCEANHHVVFHADTGTCGCEYDCPHLYFLADSREIYNSTDHTCECVPLQELPDPNLCKDVDFFCISEMEPRFNATLGRCDCEWIPGFEPGGKWHLEGTSSDAGNPPKRDVEGIIPTMPALLPVDCSLLEVFCGDNKQFIWNPVTEQCECQLILSTLPITIPDAADIAPRTVPARPMTLSTVVKRIVPTMWESPVPTPSCVPVSFFCLLEDEYVWNPVRGECECQPRWGLDKRSTSATAGPAKMSRQNSITPDCSVFGDFCDAGWYPAWNPVVGDCECRLFKGIGPVIASTTRSPLPTEPGPVVVSTALSPVTTANPLSISRRGICRPIPIFCGIDKIYGWDPVTESCGCHWIQGREPTTCYGQEP